MILSEPGEKKLAELSKRNFGNIIRPAEKSKIPAIDRYEICLPNRDELDI